MQVKLLTHTPDPLKVIWTQARGCYSPGTFDELWEEFPGEEAALKLVRKVLGSGHWSVTRGTHYTFSITGVSRACSHQLVRHTIGVSWEQQSQRYVEVRDKDWYVTPAHWPTDIETWYGHIYKEAVLHTMEAYQQLLALGVDKEDARLVLPNATRTNLIGTFSFEALHNFLSQRLCTLAQWEIRDVAKQMRKEALLVTPWAKDYFTIKCIPTMTCTEAKARLCPLLRENGGKVEWKKPG